MYNVDSIKGLKPEKKPSAATYWIIMICCFGGGIACFFAGANGIVIGIIGIIAGFIVRWFYKNARESYNDYIGEQRRVYRSILDIVNNSKNCFKSLKRNQQEAKTALNRAETDFKDGAYSPFWDAVERTALELGHFSENLHNLSSYMKTYLEWVPLSHQTPSKFPVSSDELKELHELGVENALAKQMAVIVRNAQRDYHFTAIYEQRKTQKLLVAGFESFSDVLNSIGNQISDHVGHLNSTVEFYNSEMIHLMTTSEEQSEQHHSELMEAIKGDSDE